MTPLPMKNEENEVWDLENLKLVLRFVKRDFSRYTLFIPLFKFSKSFLHLEDKFSLYLKLNYRSKRYKVAKIANAITNLVCCGIDRFVRMDDEFKIERGLAKSLGFAKGFFTSDTAYRFFRSFNGWNIRQLEKVNLQLLKEQKKNWYPIKGSLFIDLDMNVKSVEGKQIEKAVMGYNRKRQGRLCLCWTVAHIAKVAIYSELDKGTASGKTELQRQVRHVEKLMQKIDIKRKTSRIVWRIDGGYFSGKNLLFLSFRKFITRIPCSLKVVRPYLKGKESKHLNWNKYSKKSEYVDIGTVLFPDIKIELRLVIVKVHRKKKIVFYPLCTNIFKWTARNIVKSYRGRQILENCFRDTNQAFYGSKLPSSTFCGNQAFLWFIVLAYNQFFFFQKSRARQKIKQINT